MLDLLIRITENVIIAVGGPQTPAGRPPVKQFPRPIPAPGGRPDPRPREIEWRAAAVGALTRRGAPTSAPTHRH
jgi:hypothetical protein